MHTDTLFKLLSLLFLLSFKIYPRWINPQTIHQTKDVFSYLPGVRRLGMQKEDMQADNKSVILHTNFGSSYRV